MPVWQAGAAAYNSISRPNAVGPQLDNIGALTGTRREGAFPSTVFCACTFTTSGTYAAGALVAYLPGNTTVQFKNVDAVVVPVSTPMPISPTNRATVANVLFEAMQDGEDLGNALVAAGEGSLTGMVPVSGWYSVADSGAPSLGSLGETDDAYRARQVLELSAPGACTLDAAEAAIVLALANAPNPAIATVAMYENTSLMTDANGLPGKSFSAVVFDGSSYDAQQNDPLIAQAIWNNKPAGMQTYGNTSATAVDAQGDSHTVYFSRVSQVPNLRRRDGRRRAGLDARPDRGCRSRRRGGPRRRFAGAAVHDRGRRRHPRGWRARDAHPGPRRHHQRLPRHCPGSGRCHGTSRASPSASPRTRPERATFRILAGQIAVMQTPVVTVVAFAP